MVTTILNEEMHPGEHTVTFDANGFASGTYFSHLRVGRQVLMKSMTMIK